jgi:hypothetical protein
MYAFMYGLCPQVTGPIPFTWGYICPDLRDGLTIGATGTTTRTAKTQMRPALTMTIDQVSSLLHRIFLFSALSALVCSLFRRFFVSITETSKMIGMLKLYAAE